MAVFTANTQKQDEFSPAYKSIQLIIPKEKVEELRLLPNFEDIEDNLQALNGWDENSNYFFGKIMNDCEPGNFVLDCDIPIWYYDEVETEFNIDLSKLK